MSEPTDKEEFSHELTSGKHSHRHSAYGYQGNDETHEHEHEHNGDAGHKHHKVMSFIEELVASGAPLGIEQEHDEWRVLDNTGEVLVADAGTYEAALAEVRKRFNVDDRPVLLERWRSDMAFEGTSTDDGRYIEVGAISFRDTPLPLMLQTETEVGHFGAILAGSIEEVGKSGSVAIGRGSFDDSEAGKQALSVIQARGKFGVSVDIGAADGVVDEESGNMRFTKAEIMGLTMTPFPAFADAYIEIDTMAQMPGDTPQEMPIAASTGSNVAVYSFSPSTSTTTGYFGKLPPAEECEECEKESVPLTAAAPLAPPAEWFTNPEFFIGDDRLVEQANGSYACPLTVHDDGHVFGHIASFKSCHTGYADRCVPPPRSPSGYAYFTTGTVTTAEGDVVRVGQLTMGAGHANTRPGMSVAEVHAHYDGGPGAVQMADVNVGEDQFGIWFSGALRPDVTDEQVRAFMACGVSGDWREVVRGKGLDLVACAAGIPVPGFPIARAIAASALGDTEMDLDLPMTTASFLEGEPVALVAAGIIRQPLPWENALAHQAHEIEELKARLTRAERVTSQFRAEAAEKLASALQA